MKAFSVRLLLLLLLLLAVWESRACYLNLAMSGSGSRGSGVSKSIEDLAESSPIVLTGHVLNTTASGSGSGSRRSYSAEIQVLEVLKGNGLLPLSNRSAFDDTNDRTVVIDEYGDPVSCLSEVFQDDWLIFFLSKSGSRLMAFYARPSAATAQLTESNLARAATALGWFSWSSWTACSGSCGLAGIRQRVRNCAGPPCDYGDAKQTRQCNRWPCEAMRPVKTEVLGEQLNAKNTSNESIAIPIDNQRIEKFSKETALALMISPILSGIRVAMETVAEDHVSVLTMTSASSMWRDISTAPSVAIYLRIIANESEGSFAEFSIECLSSGSVPVPGAGSKFILTPRKALLSANFVPWSEATDCSEEQKVTPPPTYWTAWSSCSATCGEGIRSRHSLCRGNSPADSCHPAGSRPPVESRPCPSLPLCNPDHSAGSAAGCSSCLNGGFCYKSRCICPTSYTGDRCQTVLSEQPVPTQPKLPLPTASPPRRRWKFDCRRRAYGRGRRRRKSATVCRNGGVCDPRTGGDCRCPMGWSGRRCRKPLCRPQCRNGGACVGPNLCACAAGFSGTQCQTADCYPPCVNGGTCIRPGKCSCPPGYRGRFCHRVRCHRSLCLNGGRCIESDGLCRCRVGFYGARCQRRNCTPELSYRKTYRPVVKRLRKPTVQPCSPGSKRYCLLNSLSKVVVFKIILRPYFTCSST
ncbi:hypothetical protein BOX15_Mlig010866g2 [Macrostomum lignano]|uniref:EGF-like domain-containing protein n=1 Tax=Macrostomum lignano TaxID=282301 RepID=A0A267E2J4_9PLAT|nr:hypothetical protein BOX15_Mlig010866g2 [Macrostomum lignano]